MFLTADELRTMTGYKRPADQSRWLSSRGWMFEHDAAGRPIVLRTYAEHRLGNAAHKKSPNFAAIRRSA
jgi:hypothetical protein